MADAPAGRARARGEQQIGLLLAREIEQMKQARSSKLAGREILDHQRAGGERRRQVRLGERARAPGRGRPHRLAQIAARWLLPEPSGPTSTTARAGQSGQLSISASAAALDGPSRKSSRAKLSA